MAPGLKVGTLVKVSGIAGGNTTVTGTIVAVDALGYTVQLSTTAHGCRTWHALAAAVSKA